MSSKRCIACGRRIQRRNVPLCDECYKRAKPVEGAESILAAERELEMKMRKAPQPPERCPVCRKTVTNDRNWVAVTGCNKSVLQRMSKLDLRYGVAMASVDGKRIDAIEVCRECWSRAVLSVKANPY